MRPHRTSRGITLIELMVALAIMAIVLAALLSVVQGQQTAYYEGHLQRGAQGAARSALEYVQQRVAMAGYGMDGSLAFDFDRYPPLPCPPQNAGCPRDATNGNDELVFYSRNPRYWVPETYDPPSAPITNPPNPPQPVGNAWRISAIAGNQLTIDGHGGDFFARGQIVQAVCRGAEAYAYFTIAANTLVPGAPGAIVPDTNLPLVPSTSTDPFLRQDAFPPQTGATLPCFSKGTARLFLIDRYRFHVRPIQAAGGFRPYLVLDQGIDADGDGPSESDEIVVAEGIEVFQVGYVMTNPALLPRGVIEGTPIVFAPGVPAGAGNNVTTLSYPGPLGEVPAGGNEYTVSSFAKYAVGPPPATERMTDHQGNIRAVQIFVQARGADPDPGTAHQEVLTPILNMDALPPWIDPAVPYNRARVSSTVLVRNMMSRGVTDF